MELVAPPSLPFERRDAYEVGDDRAYLKLQDLRCIRHGVDISASSDPLCSLCKEVLLGERLIDGNGNDTEYRIAFYELPCGHQRCCSCALKWLDTAGLFHRICHYCDSQKLNVKPNLSELLDPADAEPDLSWIKGFPKKKRSISKSPTAYSPTYLATIEEIPEYDNADASKEIDVSALALQTPAKRRKINPETPHASSYKEVAPFSSPDQYQWTPIRQYRYTNTTADDEQITPEAGFDYDEITADTLTSRESLKPHSAMEDKESRLFLWSLREARDCDGYIHGSHKSRKAPRYDELEEEEPRVRKKPRYAI